MTKAAAAIAKLGTPLNSALASIGEAMPTVYTILSDNFAGGNAGETVTSDELTGCNIPALIEAGHITAQTQTTAETATNKEQ